MDLGTIFIIILTIAFFGQPIYMVAKALWEDRKR